MFKKIFDNVWVFDVEWMPDPVTIRTLYGLPPETTDDATAIAYAYDEARKEMEKKTGRPGPERPYLKLALCRVVSLAAIKRHRRPDGVIELELRVMPDIDMPMGERTIIDTFLRNVGKVKPQLCGYNIVEADIPMLVQRAIAHRLYQPGFGWRPDKPWEGVDYFGGKFSDAVLDLLELLGAFGQAKPKLGELCLSCAIPGKFGGHGGEVVDWWLAGEMNRIVRYQVSDVLSEYELFLRCLLFSGRVSPADYEKELTAFNALLSQLIASGDKYQVTAYVEERDRLERSLTNLIPPAPPPTDKPQLTLLTQLG
jgi:predicted PolB exonuclease-like 3'-5' exonuclease